MRSSDNERVEQVSDVFNKLCFFFIAVPAIACRLMNKRKISKFLMSSLFQTMMIFPFRLLQCIELIADIVGQIAVKNSP